MKSTMTFLLVLALLSIGVLECRGESYYVDPVQGSSSANCTESSPCKTIKEAIAKAQYGGDEIVLASGTYQGSDNGLFELSKAINFVAQDDMDIPVIDLKDVGWFAKWSPQYLTDTAQVASISNILFQGGTGNDYDPSVFQIMGGSSLTFSGCVFLSNVAEQGSTVVIGSHDEDLSVEGPTLVSFLNCVFSSNTAEEGGAVKIYKGNQRVVLFFTCQFSDNAATTGNGGVILSSDNVPLSVFHSIFEDNSAKGEGGAIYVGESGTSTPIFLTNTQFIGNSAVGKGGAVAAIGGTLTLEDDLFKENNVIADSDGQHGGGLYASGSVLSTNTTFRGNACPVTGTTPPNLAGGALYLTGTASSFFRGSSFDSNSCTHGSDFASDLGTSTIIDSSVFEADELHDLDLQILTKGTVRLHDCNFTNSGDIHEIRSIWVGDGGLVSLGYSYEPPQLLTILALVIGDDAFLQAPVELNIQGISSTGGTIESTSSFGNDVLTIGILDLKYGATTISGFDVVVTDSVISSAGLFLSNSLTTTGTSTFGEGSYVRSLDSGVSIPFKNEGLMDVIDAVFYCDFSNAQNASLKLPRVIGTGPYPFSIVGAASFLGNLTVIVMESGIAVYHLAEGVPLISYSSLYDSKFTSVTIKNVSNPELVYGETVLSLQNGKGGGLTGGAVAGIIIGLTIALSLITFAVWFFVIRPQNDDLARSYQVEGGGSSDGGYGAVE